MACRLRQGSMAGLCGRCVLWQGSVAGLHGMHAPWQGSVPCVLCSRAPWQGSMVCILCGRTLQQVSGQGFDHPSSSAGVPQPLSLRFQVELLFSSSGWCFKRLHPFLLHVLRYVSFFYVQVVLIFGQLVGLYVH